jgi:hypothetical protein
MERSLASAQRYDIGLDRATVENKRKNRQLDAAHRVPAVTILQTDGPWAESAGRYGRTTLGATDQVDHSGEGQAPKETG